MLRSQAKALLETWEKETLIDSILNGMTAEELKEFVEENEG